MNDFVLTNIVMLCKFKIGSNLVCTTHLSLGIGDDLAGDASHVGHGTGEDGSGGEGA